jgi:DNA-binding CsgD family transcriptional regulator
VQGRGVYHLRAAELALAHGRPEDAYRHVELGLALAAGTDDTAFRSEMGALAVRCLADDVEDARTRRRRYDIDKAKLLALGFEQEIDRVIEAPAERGGRCPPRAEAFAAMCVAELSRVDTSDPARWDAAARRWEVAGEPHPLAYCRWRQAEALLAQRAGRSKAAEHLNQAWQLAAGMGAAPLQAEIERLATRARLELAGPETSDAAGSTVGSDLGLTRREVEVLGHLAAGRTDRQIAESLFISKKTVSVHVSSVLRKLDVPNRVEAGRVGQALGVIEPAGQR